MGELLTLYILLKFCPKKKIKKIFFNNKIKFCPRIKEDFNEKWKSRLIFLVFMITYKKITFSETKMDNFSFFIQQNG